MESLSLSLHNEFSCNQKRTISSQCFVTWLIPSFHWSRFQHKPSSVGGLTGESENNQNRHDMTLHDVRWHDMTRHDMTGRDMKWHDATGRDVRLRENVMTGHDVTGHVHGMTGRDVTWLEVTWHNTARRFALSDHRYTFAKTDHVARSCTGIATLDSKRTFYQTIVPGQRRVAHNTHIRLTSI